MRFPIGPARRLVLLSVLAAVIPSVRAAGQVITEYSLPTEAAGAGAITAGPDGAMWFTEVAANRIGRIDSDGVVSEFALPTAVAAPNSIAAGSDGILWFTEALGNAIGRIGPSGQIVEFAVPTPGSSPSSITAGPDGSMWFVEAASRRVGRITPSGLVTEFSVEAGDHIVSGPDGNLWLADYYGFVVVRLTPATGASSVFPVSDESYPSSIAAGPDGNLWILEVSTIGRMTPGGTLTEFHLPSGSTGRGGIAAGPDGNLWFTVAEGKVGRITPAGSISEFPLPTLNGSSSSIAVGHGGDLWITEYAANKIARVALAEPGACGAGATTLCLGSGRFRIQAYWHVPADGRSGYGTAMSLGGNTGGFWFFDPSGLDLVVKTIDGCSLNGRYWVFAAGLTNVGVDLVVTDTRTGVTLPYSNPDGAAFAPIQDTSAFAACP